MAGLPMLCVMIGGGVGALARYVLSTHIGRIPTSFPAATFTVNILGCFLLGVFIALMGPNLPAKSREMYLLIAVGFLGGFTTFSAFSFDLFVLMQRGLWGQLALYAGGSVLFSVLALVAGMWMAQRLAGA